MYEAIKKEQTFLPYLFKIYQNEVLIINVRHFYHKFLSSYENITLKCSYIEEKSYIAKNLNVLVNRTLQLSRSISILFEANLLEDVAILSRTLLETTFRIGYIVIDKEKSLARTTAYMSDMEYKSKLLTDIDKLKINLPFEEKDAKKLMENEKKEIISLLKIDENDLEEKRNLIKMAEELKLLQAYSMYYRYFSQYVHSKSMIWEMEDEIKRNSIGEKSLTCSCYCWLLLSDYLNHYFDLKQEKKIRTLAKDFNSLVKYQFNKRNIKDIIT